MKRKEISKLTTKDLNVIMLAMLAFGCFFGITLVGTLPPYWIGIIAMTSFLVVMASAVYMIVRGRQLKRERKLNAEKVNV